MKNTSLATALSPKALIDDLHALVAEAEKLASGPVAEHTAEAIAAP